MSLDVTAAFVQVQQPGRPTVEARALLDTLATRGIAATPFSLKQLRRKRLPLSRTTLVAGDHDVMRAAFQQLEIDGPWLPTYPAGTEHFLHRSLSRSTLAAARQHVDSTGERLFIKPADAHKRFTGFVYEPHAGAFAFNGASGQTEVWCSSPVEFGAEFRAYVVDGEVLGVCPYQGEETDVTGPTKAARTIVEGMRAAGSLVSGFSIDVGRLEGPTDDTYALVECNDGFALGLYEGLSHESYARLIEARWLELVAAT
jgi:hypothetical protein